MAALCSRTRVHVVDDGRLTTPHAHRGPALRDESGPALHFSALRRRNSLEDPTPMSVSRFTTLTLALGAITLGAAPSVWAQTTTQATTTTPTTVAAPASSVTQQSAATDAEAPDQATGGPDRNAGEGRGEEQDDRGGRARRHGRARRPQRPLGRQRVQLPAARLRAVRRAILRRERSGRARLEHLPAAPRSAGPGSHGVQVLRSAADAGLRRRHGGALRRVRRGEAECRAQPAPRKVQAADRPRAAAVGDRRAVHRARPADEPRAEP